MATAAPTRYNSLVKTGDLDPQDVRSAVAARHELGAEYESQVIEGFLDRIGTAIDERVEARLAARGPVQPPRRQGDHPQFVVVLASLVLGIPLTAIASSNSGLIGVIVVWFGIVAINFAYALRP
jgi:hypothetical protein